MSCPIKQSLYNIYICIEKYSYILYNYKLMGQLYFLNNRKSCYGSHKTQKLALPNSHVRDYPKDCVNLQTDVRYNYTVWRYYYGKKKRQPTKSCNETNDV